MRELVKDDITQIPPEYNGNNRIIHILILQRSGGTNSKQVHSDSWRVFGVQELNSIQRGIQEISMHTKVTIADLGTIPIIKQVLFI